MKQPDVPAETAPADAPPLDEQQVRALIRAEVRELLGKLQVGDAPTDEEVAAKARLLMGARLGELSAAELKDVYVESMKLAELRERSRKPLDEDGQIAKLRREAGRALGHRRSGVRE